MTSTTDTALHPFALRHAERHRRTRGLREGRRRNHQALQRRPPRQRHRRQGRPRRGPPRHRLQDRRRHPLPRAVHQHDVDPDEVVSLGDEIEALVLTKEDKEGRLLLSKKRAQYERAWGNIEEIKEADGVVEGPVIEVVKGGLIVDIGLRGFLPASLVELRRVRDLQPYIGKTVRGQDHRARQEPQQRGAVPPGLPGGDADGGPHRLPRPTSRRARSARASSRASSTSVRSSTSAAWTASSTSRELSWKHVDHPVRGRRGRRRGHGRGARRRLRTASASRCR